MNETTYRLPYFDLAIAALFLCAMVLIGLFSVRRPVRTLEGYFLGNRQLPWYALGISNASGMFDVSGTIWLISMMFVYGFKSVWFPWVWPVFNQIFLMVYLSKWMRRSAALTGADWIDFRFGHSKGATLSRLTVVLFSILSVIGYLAYGFKGMGVFISSLLPFRFFQNPTHNEAAYVAILSIVTALYIIRGGLFSVVYTELLQYSLLVVCSLAVGAWAFFKLSPDTIVQRVPDGWFSVGFGWTMDLDWSGILEAANRNIATDGFSMFTMVFTMMIIKGVLVSSAGPGPGYDLQRLLATKTPTEASKVSFWVNVVLMLPRYALISGVTALALIYCLPEMQRLGNEANIDKILPYVTSHYLPSGLMGLILAALLAAYMSNLAATIHAAPAYVAHDLYKKHLRPNALPETCVRVGQYTTLAVLLLGFICSFWVKSINTATQWIVAALYGGYTAANLLKWYWWRFNAYGYFWGMMAGIASSVLMPILAPSMSSLDAFPLILAASVFGCFTASFLTPVDDVAVLKHFYKTVRPWGFWKPIAEKVMAEDPTFRPNQGFKQDAANILVGIAWQTTLILLPMYFVFHRWWGFGIVAATAVGTSIFLKRNWWDPLQQESQTQYSTKAKTVSAAAPFPEFEEKLVE